MTPEKAAHFLYEVVLLKPGRQRKRKREVSTPAETIPSHDPMPEVDGSSGPSSNAVDTGDGAGACAGTGDQGLEDDDLKTCSAALADSLPPVAALQGSASTEERARMVRDRILNSELAYSTVDVYVSALCDLYEKQRKNCINSHHHPRAGAVQTIMHIMHRLKCQQAVLQFVDKGKSKCCG